MTKLSSFVGGPSRIYQDTLLVVDSDSEMDFAGEPTIFVEDLEEVRVIRLFGEHDVATANDLKVAVRQAAIDGKGAAVCLAHVTFMDSAVVHALCVSDRTLWERGRRLAIYTEPRGIADRVLELCRLNETLLFGDTLEEAIEFARQSHEPAPAA